MNELNQRQNSLGLTALLAFAAVYVIWGSTYLAIRIAIETLPALTMAGVRFLTAGSLLLAWVRWRDGGPWPALRQWRSAALLGLLLLVGGNGSVVLAEYHVPSGIAALIVGTEPLFIVLLLMFWRGGERPSRRTVVALLIGFAGAAILAAPGKDALGTLHLPSVLLLFFACLTWAAGSLYARNADLPSSPLMGAAMQMLTGGSVLLVLGGSIGEWKDLQPSTFSLNSILALAYLIFFGAIVAYTAYNWLVRNVRPTLVATYAYVNPVVAVFLGWLIVSEPLSTRTFIAAALILGAVFIVGSERQSRKQVSREEASTPPSDSTESPRETSPEEADLRKADLRKASLRKTNEKKLKECA
ncbi:MAG: drug/metabolite exporter YedA [Deltaproteobacteria bacterium]|nr:drug/metabolite exporter YedA [Deltaproteobacteria bacterium]